MLLSHRLRLKVILSSTLITWCFGCSSETTQKTSEASPAEPLLALTQLSGDRSEPQSFTINQISPKIINEQIYIDDNDFYEVDFVQSNETPPNLDILIVVDNSGSMSEEQKNLGSKLNHLLKYIIHSNWRINVITTDDPCPKFPFLPISQGDDNFEENFATAINVGISGSVNEKGQEMLVKHLKGEGKCTPDWLRPDARLAILFLSDENEDLSSKVKPVDVISALEEKGYVPGETVKVYGFFWHPTQPLSMCPSALGPAGAAHAELVELTKGLWGSICAADYSKNLQEISKDVGNLMRTVFSLGHEPEISTVAVILDGENLEDGSWMIMGDQIIIFSPLEPGTSLKVHFATRVAKAVSLSSDPVVTSIKVFIENKTLEPSEYRYIENENALVFLQPLPIFKDILITYEEKTILPATFAFPTVDTGLIECFYEGKQLSHQYFKEDGLIVFDSAPPAGSKVKCLYQR